MELGKAGWLAALLDHAAAEHLAQGALVSAPPGPPGRARARAYLRQVIRESGLLYGTPAMRAAGASASANRPPGERLFLAVAGTFARIALDVATLAGAPGGPRREQSLALFAALCGLWEEAEGVSKGLARGEPPTRRQWSSVEQALEQRALSLSGDRAFGLVLHNGAVCADANAFGRMAVDFFVRGDLQVTFARRRLEACGRQKAVLAEVLTALVCAERRPSLTSRRAILRQIEDLRLPAEQERQVIRSARSAFGRRRPGLPERLGQVRSAEMKRFILEQTLLGSLVDGRRSGAELAFVQALADRLGVSRPELAAFELGVAGFYRRNRDVVDVFTVSAVAGAMGDRLFASMKGGVENNFRRLLNEIRETGEMSVLLSKAARGHALGPDEKRRMREQLIDLARAVPALAIFAAPGGLFLLIALSRVLPFSLLPSSFRDDPPPPLERR